MSPEGFRLQLIHVDPRLEWVVLLPGAGATTSVWWRQRRAFGERFNLALVDLPGHGRGRSPPDGAEPGTARYTFDGLISELADTVLRAGIERCHVVALSLGTLLARGWATRNPERISSLVLAGTIAELSPVVRGLMLSAQQLKHTVPYMLLYRTYAWLIMPGPAHRRTRALFYRDARKIGQREFKRWLNLVDEAGLLLETLGRHAAQVPTLHVLGERDYMFKRSALRLAARHPAQDVCVIPGVGHVCTLEAPDAFNRAALAFMEQHSKTLHLPV